MIKKYATLWNDLEYAAAAGFSTAFPSYFLLKQEAEQYDYSFPNQDAIFILAALPCAYLLAAILLWAGRNTFIGLKVPHWLSLPFIGSLLFVLFIFLYAILAIHGNIKFITHERVLVAGLFSLGLTAYTLIFTSLVRYLPTFILRIRKR
jgi:hypothetical protein